MTHQGIQLIDRTDRVFVGIDPNDNTPETMYKFSGSDTRTYAWIEVCPYTGKETNHNRTYTFDGIGNWV